MGLNELYKYKHRPILNNEKLKFKLGYYIPEHPEKCLTPTVIYRSGWEFAFCTWCDRNEAVLQWASEPIGIKYLNPIANLQYCMDNGLNPSDPGNWKVCTYYTDFWIEVADDTKEDGKKRIFIEIKPYDLTLCPAPISETATLKERKAYNRAAETYALNMEKWKAAKLYFESRGAEFLVITEERLKKMGLL